MQSPPVDEAQAIWLSEKDVASLQLTPAQVREAVRDAFLAYDRGTLLLEPKGSLVLGPGHSFQTLTAADHARGHAVVKWAGVVPPGGTAGPNITATILLSDASTGRLRCVMGARHATALRTAAMSALAASYLARRASYSIGFVGAGIQAEAHLLALRDVLGKDGKIGVVLVASRSDASAQRLVDLSRVHGLDARVVDVAKIAACADVLVTSVPSGPGFQPMLDASALRPGALTLSVDLGRPWKSASVAAADLLVVDHAALRQHAKAAPNVPPLEWAQATLSDLIGGRHPGRSNDAERIMYFSSGTAVADLAIAALIHERAQASGVGTRTPL